MDHLAQELQEAVEKWDALGFPRPDVFVVSGSGLATGLGERLLGPRPWTEIIPFPIRGIEGHPLEIELLRSRADRVVLYSRGRLHSYQGFSPAQVVFTVRFAALLGAKMLLMTNSSGGLQPHHQPGDLVLVRDHLNLTGDNPLYGSFPSTWGPQFPDMAGAYDPTLRSRIRAVADSHDIALHDGVYASVAGPSYETPAEVVMLRRMGADVVGMSTAQEVIAARHMGMRCAVVSLIANPAAGVTDDALDHEDVLAVGRAAGEKVAHLLQSVLADDGLLDPPASY